MDSRVPEGCRGVKINSSDLVVFFWLACRGYWKDPENVEAELRKFMAAQGISGRMPSCTELREAGAFTLYSAISKHGGVGAFAKQLG